MRDNARLGRSGNGRDAEGLVRTVRIPAEAAALVRARDSGRESLRSGVGERPRPHRGLPQGAGFAAGGSGPAVLLILCLVIPAVLSGCGSSAGTYAREARSSYISARAVLVGVQEFPGAMEGLLRSVDSEALRDEALGLIEDTRDILPAASSAFRAVSEKCELLLGEGSDRFEPYARKLMELVALNEEMMAAYSEFIGVSNSVLQGFPYESNPQNLMPSLDFMDATTRRIEELSGRISLLEEEAEALYLEITG